MAEERRERSKDSSKLDYYKGDLPGEEWREILGYPDYMVSNRARIRRYAKRYHAWYLRRQYSNEVCDGRMYIILVNSQGESKSLSVARIVAHAFCEGFSSEKNTVNHIDGNASYSNEAISNVTSKCTFSPVAGKVFDPATDTAVTVSYTEGEITKTLTFPLVAKNFNSLSVTTLPRKVSYKAGDVISYDGITVTASYSDGSTSDVTDKCTFSPAAGKAFNPGTDINVSVSYVENNITQNCSFNLAETTLTELTVKPARTSFKSGEAIRYLGTVVKAVYSDNSTEDVTSKCTFSPAAGKAFNPATDTTVTVNYTEGEITRTFSLTETVLTDITIIHQPKKKEYREGEVTHLRVSSFVKNAKKTLKDT